MECSRIPPADQWHKASVQQLEEYRRHIQFCQSCRKRCIALRPEELLFELNDSALPEDFWIGFWDSLEKKLPHERTARRRLVFPIARWAAVFIAACLLVLFHKDLSESPSSIRGELNARPFILQAGASGAYPIIDDLQNPRATYYIFQPSEDENIVMMFDPDLEL
jgi:hypothetical protein